MDLNILNIIIIIIINYYVIIIILFYILKTFFVSVLSFQNLSDFVNNLMLLLSNLQLAFYLNMGNICARRCYFLGPSFSTLWNLVLHFQSPPLLTYSYRTARREKPDLFIK